MISIISKELRLLFLSPLAWTILSITSFILAWLFIINVDRFLTLQTKLAAYEGAPGVTAIVVMPLFSILGVVLLMIIPLLTMRLISEERRNNTLNLLMAAPVTSTDIILGKYFSILIFIFAILTTLILMALSLSLGTSLDYGLFTAGIIGTFLMLASFTAIGLFLSSLTSQPATAAISTFGALFMLWIINWAENVSNEIGENELAHQIFAWLSIIKHQENFMYGLINSTDLIYYILISTFFILLSIRNLENKRMHS